MIYHSEGIVEPLLFIGPIWVLYGAFPSWVRCRNEGGVFCWDCGGWQISPNKDKWWAIFGAQAGIFGIERLHFYLSMIVKTKWKACCNGQLAQQVCLPGSQSPSRSSLSFTKLTQLDFKIKAILILKPPARGWTTIPRTKNLQNEDYNIMLNLLSKVYSMQRFQDIQVFSFKCQPADCFKCFFVYWWYHGYL